MFSLISIIFSVTEAFDKVVATPGSGCWLVIFQKMNYENIRIDQSTQLNFTLSSPTDWQGALGEINPSETAPRVRPGLPTCSPTTPHLLRGSWQVHKKLKQQLTLARCLHHFSRLLTSSLWQDLSMWWNFSQFQSLFDCTLSHEISLSMHIKIKTHWVWSGSVQTSLSSQKHHVVLI